MAFVPGARFGPYEVLSLLGAGGMGEVYRARDTRLGRDVAIKVLPERLAADANALSRFEREARAVAALSHPNILAIHDFGEDHGVRFAVTELLDGETLRERITGERLSWRKAVEIGVAIIDGLSVAHAKGIVHRDLKPENVFITSDGLVKILDFGIARSDVLPCGEVTSTPTASIRTEVGTVLGTVGYMSPEQVRGESVDARSDIFSFGCLLYEMLSGRRAFEAKSRGETLASTLRDHPPEISAFGVALPAVLERVVARCLEKNRDERFQSARDLAFHLKEVSSGSALPAPSSGGHGPIIESIAVLPFSNESGDPDTEYLSDGIAEGIIHSLSRLSNLRVMARSTLSRYKGREIDPRAVGEELKVRALLTGRVFHRGESLVIKAELVDVRDGSQIWGENYNRKFVDILALEEEISREISGTLRVRITGEDAQRLARRETENTEAYRLCLKGRFYWNKRTAEALRKGIEYFNLAIELDPEYAKAYAGVADCYNNLGFYDIVAPEDSFPKAKAAAMRALEIDDSLAGARAALGYALLYYDWDWDGAEREFRRAIARSPDYPTAHQFYANHLIWAGRAEEAIAETRRALELDPLSLINGAALGYSLHLARRPEEAVVQLRKTLEMDPTFVPVHLFLGYVFLQVGRYPEAIRQFQEVMRLADGNPIAYAELGCAYAASGQRADAEEVLKDLVEISKRRFVSPYCLAILHTALGETDSAFADLEKALALRAHEMIFLLVEPQLDSLRSDPRFGDLLRRMSL